MDIFDQIKIIRSRIIDKAWLAVIIFFIPSLALSLYRVASTGWVWNYVLHIILAVLTLVFFLLRKKLSVNFKISVLLIFFLAIFIGSIITFSLSGSLFMGIGAVFLSTLLFGRRIGFISATLVLIIFILFMLLHTNKVIPVDVDFNVYNSSLSSWLAIIGGYALLMLIMIFSIGMLYELFIGNIRGLITQNDEIAKAYKDLSDNKVDLMEQNKQFEIVNKELRSVNTQLSEAKEKVLRSEEMVRMMLANSEDVFMLMNGDGEVIYLSDSIEKHSGFTVEELQGPIADSIYYEDVNTTLENWWKVLKEIGSSQTFEYKHKHKTNGFIWVEVVAHNHLDNSIVNAVVVNVRNVHERKIVEQKLIEAEVTFRALFEEAADAIFIADLQTGMIVEANSSAQVLMQFAREELLQMHQSQLHPPHVLEYSKELFEYAISQYMQIGKAVPVEIPVLRANGTFVETEILASLIMFKGKQCVMGTFRDITERKKIQQEIQEAKEFSDALIDGMPGIFYLYDESLRLRRWNKNHETMLGYASEELYGKHISEWHSNPEMGKIAVEGIQDVFIHGGTRFFDGPLLHKNGNEIMFFVSATSMQTPQGKIMFGFGTDITARKDLQNAYLESEQRFKDLVNLLPQAIYEADIEGKLLFVNAVAFTMFGYNQEDFDNGYNIADMVAPSSLTLLKENMYRIIQKIPVENNEYIGRRKDGSTFPILVYSSVIYKDSQISGLRGVILDISERKKSEYELQVSEDRYKSLIETSADGISLMDLQGTMLIVNERKAQMVGAACAKDLVGTNAFNLLTPESRDAMVAFTPQLLELRTVQNLKATVLRLDGSTFPAEFNVTIISNDAGEPLYIMDTMHDISARIKNEEKIRHLLQAVEQSPESIVITNKEGNIEYINPRFTQNTGYSIDEVIGKNPRILRNSEYNSVDYKDLWEAISTGNTWRGEFLNVKKNGELYWENASISPIVNDSGEITHYVAIKEDITEQKRIQEEILTQSLRFQAIIESTKDIVFALDNNMNYLAFNTNHYNTMKYIYNVDIEVGKCILDCMPFGHDREVAEQDIRKGLDGNNYSIVQEYGDTALNRTYFEATYNPITNSEGTVTGVAVFVKDFTEYKRAERALKASEEYNRTIVHILPDLIIKTNADCEYLDIISTNDESLIAPRNELIGKNFSEFLPEQEFILIQNAVLQSIEKQTIQILEYSLPIYSQIRWFEGRFLASTTDEVFILVRDITQRKQSEIDLLVAKEKAEESDSLKTAFLQNMSHEIRTPMNAIVGFADLLPEYYDDMGKMQQFTGIIKQRSNDLLGIINDLLDISKIEAGQMPLSITDCTLQSILKDINAEMSFYIEQNKKQHLNFSFEEDASIQQQSIKTDRGKLKQIIINLVTNAIKYTHEGSVVCGYTTKDTDILFYVKDTGVGIPEEQQSIIFDRFTRLQHSQNFNIGGTGIGLSIAKGLAELLGGGIWVESKEGEGSTFYFTIPFDYVQKPIELQPISDNVELSFGIGKTILVVEDDEYNAKYLQALLQKTHAKIILCVTGADAIVTAKNTQIDLILMDIRLPDMSGLDVTKKILVKKPQMPIIAQTAFASQNDREEVKKAGCVGFLSKPINAEVLYKKLKKHLG